MSNLTTLINDAKAGLSIQESIPDPKWDAIATHCGAPEVAESETRIAALKAALATVEAWDGDTQDDIHFAISRFSRLLALTAFPSGDRSPTKQNRTTHPNVDV